MFVQSVAANVGRLAMTLLFALALAGCGDDTDGTAPVTMDPHEHEHEHEGEHEGEFPGRLMVMDAENYQLNVFDLESERVVATFDDHDGFEKGQADGFTHYVRGTSDGRYGFVLQRSRNLPLDDPSLAENRIFVIDGGLTVEEHGGHLDPVWGTPTLLPYRLGHGGGEVGLFNPVHFVSHHGLTAIFFDGIAPSAEGAEVQVDEQNGFAVAYDNSDFDSDTLPDPIFELDIGNYSHGAAVAVHDDLFIVTLADPAGGLPNGVATYDGHAHDNSEVVQTFPDTCPRLHGEAVSGPYVAFGCLDGEGILVLIHDEESDSFDHAVVAYPDSDMGSGGVAGGTGPSGAIFMARYGDRFIKITKDDIEDGLQANPEVIEVEAGNERYRGFAFEPYMDHNFGGEGRFVALSRTTGNLYIFDLTMEAGEELVGQITGIVGDTSEGCPNDQCPDLALAPGFAYVSNPTENKVYEVNLEEAEIEREFELNAPAELVVFGWFGLEEELVFH